MHAAARTQARDVYRTSILEAAERVFAERGWDATKVADIAREAGLAAGTLYNYFDSKERILESIIEWRGGQSLEQARALNARPGAPLDRLRAYMTWMLGYLEHDSVGLRMYAEAGSSPVSRMFAHNRCISDNRQQHLDLLGELVAAAQQAGALRRDRPARELTLALGGMVGAAIETWIQSSPRPSLVEQVPALLDIFLNGAKTP